MARLTDDFLTHFYYGVREDYLEQVKGVERPFSDLFLTLTRLHAFVVSTDREGKPRGTIKSIGFIPKVEYLEEAMRDFDAFINWRWEKIKEAKGPDYEGEASLYSPHPDFLAQVLEQHLKWRYLPKEEAERKIHLDRLTTLEAYYRKTWANIQQNNKVALLFYYPPSTQFQINCTVEIQKEGPVYEFLNKGSVLLHGENPAKWKRKNMAYIFHVDEVIDKSIYPSTWKDKR